MSPSRLLINCDHCSHFEQFFKHPGKIKRRKQNPNRKKKEKKTGKNYYLKL